MPELRNAWEQFQGTVSLDQNQSAIRLSVYLVIAGLMSLYLRALYRKCSASASDSESFSRVFPILAIITTAVIAVVKSSLALSLGLVGALSIVRFRAAIKDPEELVYLFLCIVIERALGAELPLLAVAMVSVSTVFILAMHYTSRRQRADRLLLTISGNSESHLISGDQFLSDPIREQLRAHLGVIHGKFARLYGKSLNDDGFAMEIEFKVDANHQLVIKQARPWVYATPSP